MFNRRANAGGAAGAVGGAAGAAGAAADTGAVAGAAGAAEPTDIAARIWARDVSLWAQPAADADTLAGGLGWLDCVDWMQAESRAEDLQAWADASIDGGAFERVIVLGMGGSSLAAAVFGSVFADAPGLPLTVIDTTHPADIRRLAGRELRRCLFVVAGKSGDTVETADLHAFFRARLQAELESTVAGRDATVAAGRAQSAADLDAHFVFITDRDSALHRAAGGSRVFLNRADIGGRYAALSYFGLAPAALAGVDLGRLLERARDFCATTRAADPRDNPALALGMQLGRAALAGRDKLILRLSYEWRAFGLWVEQLVAESTGKDGRGILPVLVDDFDNASAAAADNGIRVYVAGDRDRGEPDDKPFAPDAADLELRLRDRYQLGAEFLRWEFATAVAAAYLRVNPFDQPDVARAKAQTAAFIRAGDAAAIGALPSGDSAPSPTPGPSPSPSPPTLCIATEWYDLLIPATADTAGYTDTVSPQRARVAIALFAAALAPKTYLAYLAYLPDDDNTASHLLCLRRDASHYARVVSTAGIGPRYLHSTGQLHKGGPATGRFIQLLDYTAVGPGADDRAATDLTIPGRDYTFSQLLRAQADGDFAALADAGRPVMRVELKPPRDEAMAGFVADFLIAMNAVAPGSPNRPA
ncbi:MAG: hypothetical protein OXU98_02550 [Gammaproteobacteria bacterium]|nr:hypothetical protein [Gammaproteobacteria bacterium]